MMGYDEEFVCIAYDTVPDCLVGQTDQQICDSNGAGYRCVKQNSISNVGNFGDWYGWQCDWDSMTHSCYDRAGSNIQETTSADGKMQVLSCVKAN